MTDKYREFLESKVVKAQDVGFAIELSSLNPMLFDWQKSIVRWALMKGKAALFEECGLGKTPQQLEWAWQVVKWTGGNVLILTPLAVARQTEREAVKFGIPTRVVRSQAEVLPGISITNYEMLEHFDTSAFVGVVLDESSILKNFMGTIKRQIQRKFAKTPYKLCCSATPSPNDHLELGNHCDFLDVMPSNEMISRWFINDTMAAGSYRLKEHGAADFWRWVCSWAVAIDKPSDIGFSDEGFILPGLDIIHHSVDVEITSAADGMLFRVADISATSLHKELRLTAPARAEVAAALVNGSADPMIVWCNSNYEATELMARIPEAIEVRGDMKPAEKEKRLEQFGSGDARVIVTKPTIAGFGLNWQHCADQVFVGLSYSYEQMYQALRRSYRFGQTKQVNAHIIYAVTEGNIAAAIEEKAAKHEAMKEAMVAAMRETQIEEFKNGRLLRMDYAHEVRSGDLWTMHNGDCVDVLKTMDADSIHMSVFSPPFSNLYIYSDSVRDMGNCADDAEFLKSMGFLFAELYRITKPGRLCAIHCKDLPLYKGRDGAAGLRDFPGDLIRAASAEGWTFASRCTIWKDPVIEMQRTKNHGLLYKQLRKDSTYSRQGMADYVIAFRKWAEVDAEPVSHTHDSFPLDQWQQWASPVWMDIDQTNVLNYQLAKSDGDERHICPLQLGVIERAIYLWSNPNDLILSPFGGIGSEGVGAMRAGRRFVGIELKPEYFDVACRFLAEEEHALTSQMTLEMGAVS